MAILHAWVRWFSADELPPADELAFTLLPAAFEARRTA